MDEDPEVFGLHANGRISLLKSETDYILTSLQTMQPRSTVVSGGGGSAAGGSGRDIPAVASTSDEHVLGLLEEVITVMPALLKRSEAGPTTFAAVGSTHAVHSLGTVLLQEMEKFNLLLDTVTTTARELQHAIKGLVVMSQELDDMYTSIVNNKVCGFKSEACDVCCGIHLVIVNCCWFVVM